MSRLSIRKRDEKGRVKSMTIQDYINQHVYPEPNTGCWLWGGVLTTKDGYAQLILNKKTHRAHRKIYEYINNTELTTDQLLCHTCDTPSCVNPTHIFIGTPKDNAIDMVNKGRHHSQTKTKQVK